MFRMQNHRGERGQILPLVAIGMVALMGMTSLAVDAGYWRYQQRLEQSAADSAAVAAAIRLNYPTTASTSSPSQIGQAAAAQNGFNDDGGVGKVTVSVSVPPSPNTPPHPGATAYPANTAAEVDIHATQKQFFSGMFGSHFAAGHARAVAVSVPDYSACLWQLKIENGSGITIKGNKPLTTVNCGVLANGTISVPSFSGTTTVGYWGADNDTGCDGIGFATAVALPTPVNDPCTRSAGCSYLASTAIPAQGAGDINGKNVTSISVPGGAAYAVVDNCCGKGNVTAGPGLYYFYGGVSGSIQGDGVTIVNVDGAFTASGLGSGHPYFTAPTSGPTAGVAYYQPPSNTNDVTLNGGGNGTSQWDGLFYAPTASFTSNGGSITFAYLVTGDIRLNGGGSGAGFIVDPTLGGQTNIMTSAVPTHVVLAE